MMKMKNIRLKTIIIASAIMGTFCITSCTKDLNRLPTNGLTSTALYSTLAGYTQSMGTAYATLAFGSAGPYGQNSFLSNYFNLQEGTTDEAILTWADPQFHSLSWTAAQTDIGAFYSTLLSNITICNNFLVESTAAKISQRGFSGADAATITQYAAEVRFLRAYYYYILMDMYGNPPLATEATLSSGDAPRQISRKDLFAFIESELKAIDPVLKDPGTNEYGRADKAAEWALLARMYLNAEVYTGNAQYTNAITYCNKIISSGYALVNNYSWLMLADNYKNTSEFIWTIDYSSSYQETLWTGTNYIALNAANVDPSVNGLNGAWNGLRMTQAIPPLFPTADTTVDKRAELWTKTQTLDVNVISDPSQGYSTYKFRNVNRDGSVPAQNNTYGNLTDIDFPVFRLAEIYLIYAESVLRGGSGGNLSTALSYVNKIRGRAYANNPSSTLGNINASQLTLNFILDERCRELYWECQRRTDLIRFKEFTTGTYLWPWKGGVEAGTSVSDIYNLFPLPASDVTANANLKQNPGY